MKNEVWVAVCVMAAAVAAGSMITGCELFGSSSGGNDGPRTIAVGDQVPGGSPLDTGSEHLSSEQLSHLFSGTEPRMMVMCHANDPFTCPGGSGDYNAEEVIQTGTLKITANSDGTLTATASDYVSPNGSGLVWKFVGYRIIGGSTLVPDNPLVLQPEDQQDTFHAYWNSYERAN